MLLALDTDDEINRPGSDRRDKSADASGHIITKLPETDVQRMRMIPAPSIESVLSEVSETAKGYIMPRGAALLPDIGKR
jgi:hypothetical protein